MPVALAPTLLLGAPADAATVKVALIARHKLVTLLPGAPGVRFDAWKLNGAIPGPLVGARVGDTIEITLHNADPMHGQPVDFHDVRKHVLRGTLQDRLTRRPAYTAFKGGPSRHMEKPIKVSVGQPVRIHLVTAGPSLGSAFHIVGKIFDAVQPDGALRSLRDTASTWYVPAGGGAVFEVTFDQAGAYPFLTHELGVASLGALGRFVAALRVASIRGNSVRSSWRTCRSSKTGTRGRSAPT